MSEAPVPLIGPPTVKLPAASVKVRVPLSVTAPVPRFKSYGPAKVKSAFQAWVLLVESVTVAPLVLPNVPPVVPPPAGAARKPTAVRCRWPMHC